MLAVGGVVAEVMTGQDTAKKKQVHLPGEGTAREGDAWSGHRKKENLVGGSGLVRTNKKIK